MVKWQIEYRETPIESKLTHNGITYRINQRFGLFIVPWDGSSRCFVYDLYQQAEEVLRIIKPIILKDRQIYLNNSIMAVKDHLENQLKDNRHENEN